jgi:hypothetical protein
METKKYVHTKARLLLFCVSDVKSYQSFGFQGSYFARSTVAFIWERKMDSETIEQKQNYVTADEM